MPLQQNHPLLRALLFTLPETVDSVALLLAEHLLSISFTKSYPKFLFNFLQSNIVSLICENKQEIRYINSQTHYVLYIVYRSSMLMAGLVC